MSELSSNNGRVDDHTGIAQALQPMKRKGAKRRSGVKGIT